MTKLQLSKRKSLTFSTLLITLFIANISHAEEAKSSNQIYLECEKKAINSSPDYGDEYDQIINECLEENGYTFSDEDDYETNETPEDESGW